MNSRYIVDSHIVRQEWDLFDRGADGLEAHRLQGKTLDGLRRKYPAFAPHWDPANFGQPWIPDYRLAGADRRPDLDLPASSLRPDLRSPLALAFYWSRRIPSNGQAATVFLPGFKKDKRVDFTIAAVEPSRDGQRLWQTSIRVPGFEHDRSIQRRGPGLRGRASVATHRLGARWRLQRIRCHLAGGLHWDARAIEYSG